MEGQITTERKMAGFVKSDELGQRRFDGWQNRLYLGDNLAVMSALREDPGILANVKLVYIDPPFATDQTFTVGFPRAATVSRSNNDKIAYVDRLVGGDYLEFIKSRLEALKDLMADDASIYVHIDCKVGHYVKVIMDEVFGEKNFINDITRVKCNAKNFKRRAYGNIKDMILFYSKTGDYIWNGAKDEFTEGDIKRLFPKIDEEGRRYTTTPLHAPGETRNGPTGQKWRGMAPPPGRHWRYPPDELEKLDESGLLEWSATGNPRKIIYAEEQLKKGKKKQDVWEYKDPAYPKYPTEKNLALLKTIVSSSSNPDDLVLDCFAGSGTTAVAAEVLGRRWLAIDNSETAMEVAKERLTALKSVSDFALFVKAANNE